MRRVVLDPGVIVSALLSPSGPPGQILAAVRTGEVEMVVSLNLLAELRIVLRRPKFATLITLEEALALDAELRQIADLAVDPPEPERVVRDPDDDYLVALARASAADVIVSGDGDLLTLEALDPPVLSPRAYLEVFPRRRGEGE